MASLTQIRSSNAQLTEAVAPKVAVFVGATDGIGKAALTELVSRGFPLKAYIVGRNEVRDKPFLAELRGFNSKAELIYREGQISLMAESKRLADEISELEQQIDLLYLSAGFLPLTGRKETSEGLELSLAVAYYSRFVFILRLLPNLRAAASHDAGRNSPRVVSVLAAGKETTNLFLDDLNLEEPGRFGFPTYAAHVATMTTVLLKLLAEMPENQDVVFLHAYPGIVSTDLMRKSWGDQWDEKAPPMGPPPSETIVRSSLEESGQRSLYLITSAEYGGKGVRSPHGSEGSAVGEGPARRSLFSVNDAMETLQQDRIFADLGKMGALDAIWDYTTKTLGPYL